MISFLVWIVMGAVVGWLASLVMKTDGSQGTLLNIIVGIVGAAVGGFAFRALGFAGTNINDGISLYSVLVSLVGAIAVIGVVQLVRGTGRRATV